jgi:hypothetical protein
LYIYSCITDIATDAEWVASNLAVTRNYFNPVEPDASALSVLDEDKLDLEAILKSIIDLQQTSDDHSRHSDDNEEQQSQSTSANNRAGRNEEEETEELEGSAGSKDGGMMRPINKFFRMPDGQIGRNLYDYFFAVNFTASHLDPDVEAAGNRRSLVVAARERTSLCPVVLKVCLVQIIYFIS